MQALDEYLQDIMGTAAWIAAAYRDEDAAAAEALAEEALAVPAPAGVSNWLTLFGAVALQMNGDVPLARRRIGSHAQRCSVWLAPNGTKAALQATPLSDHVI